MCIKCIVLYIYMYILYTIIYIYVYVCVCMCTSFLIACLVIYWNNLNIRFWICDDREARKHGRFQTYFVMPCCTCSTIYMQTYANRWAVYAICSQQMRYGTKAGAPVPLLVRTWHDLKHPDTSWHILMLWYNPLQITTIPGQLTPMCTWRTHHADPCS